MTYSQWEEIVSIIGGALVGTGFVLLIFVGGIIL